VALGGAETVGGGLRKTKRKTWPLATSGPAERQLRAAL